MSADHQEKRARFDQLQESLATRQSTTHFTHAGISVIAFMLISGAAGKLFYDSLRTPYLAWGAALLALGLLVYGYVSYRKGRVVLDDELKRYETLLALRHELHLDNPAALLPR
ncbi:hypothetical protein [Corallococcus terminator]|uniref:hypothetical protein n=1 Tax=Corallococcus terminator TaxID=2316733 RepID=UPI001FC9B9E2|nr:hypothetical protein [Corallococcus terminator]